MKTLLVIITLFSLGAGVGYVSYVKPMTAEVIVIRDITDTHKAVPDSAAMISFLKEKNKNTWDGGIFSYRIISDISLNKFFTVKLEAENKWLANEIQREKKVNDFYRSVTNILNQSFSESVGRKQSSVYRPIAEALVELSKSKSERKSLIVYSDLMENEPDFSFYNKKIFTELSVEPDSIISDLNEKVELPSLNGIEINFVYQPLNPTKDEEFLIVSGFYRKMLERKGARVNILANLAN